MKPTRLFLILPIAAIALNSCKTTNVETVETQTEQPEEKTADPPEEKIEKIEKIEEEIEETETALKKIDMTKWRYNEEDGVFFQTGIEYCLGTKDAPYRKIAFFVPGTLFKAKKNSADFYTVEVADEEAEIPYVMRIEKPLEKPMKAATVYERKSRPFTKAGFVYVLAGGESVEDFKSAVKYTRYNSELLPGTTERFYVMGEGRSGALAAMVGLESGGSESERKFSELGAAKTSGEVAGIASWSTSAGGKTDWQNESEAQKNAQTKILQESLDDFLSAAVFPFKASFTSDRLPEPEKPGEFKAAGGILDGKKTRRPKRGIPNPDEEAEYKRKKEKRDGELNGIFETPADYIAALNHRSKKNGGGDWIIFDEESGKAKITTAEGFYTSMKNGEAESEEALQIPAADIMKMLEGGAAPARFFRIREGLFSSGFNLQAAAALKEALEKAGAKVDFKAVWESGRTDAEISGGIEENTIEWINGIEKGTSR